MSYLINNQQKLNDLIFANRNKNYGAYVIRSEYGSTMVKSLSCVIFGCGCIILIAYLFKDNPLPPDIVITDPDVIFTIPFNPDKITKPEIVKVDKTLPRDPGNKKNIENSNLVISDSVAVETYTSVNETIADPVSKITSSLGTAGAGNEITEDGKKTKGGEKTDSPVMSDFEVDTGPEFEGGLAGLKRFLMSHLKYPGRALEEGIQGTVLVKFVVDEKGKVGTLALQNTLGYGLDEEAMRVVAMIPNFKSPAKVKGNAVKVYFQLPIKFKCK